MELLGLGIVVQVEVRVAQLAVDGAQHLQVLGSHLDGSFEEGDACSVVAHLTESLALQSELQAGHLHPAADRSRVRSGEVVSQRSHLLLMEWYFNSALPKSKRVQKKQRHQRSSPVKDYSQLTKLPSQPPTQSHVFPRKGF